LDCGRRDISATYCTAITPPLQFSAASCNPNEWCTIRAAVTESFVAIGLPIPALDPRNATKAVKLSLTITILRAIVEGSLPHVQKRFAASAVGQ
jgi:hypothetical protein